MKIKRESIENALPDSLALWACAITGQKAWEIKAIKTRLALRFGRLKSPRTGFAANFEVLRLHFMPEHNQSLSDGCQRGPC